MGLPADPGDKSDNSPGWGVGGEQRQANGQAPAAAGVVGLAAGADVIAAAMAAEAAAEERERGVAGEPRPQDRPG